METALALESSHYVNVGSCGHTIAQCRCPDVDRPTYQMAWPCIPCQNQPPFFDHSQMRTDPDLPNLVATFEACDV